jgi:hypothetical protein
MQSPRPTLAEALGTAGQAYVVVSEKGDLVVAPNGPDQYEDSSCVDDPCAPVIFGSRERAEKVAQSMCIDSNGFFSSWRVKALPPGCDVQGLGVLLLDDFANEAARLLDVFGLDVRAAVSA